MSTRRVPFLFVVSSLAACSMVFGCSVPTADDEDPIGLDDGDGQSDEEIVSERQLFGNELPDKTLSLTFDDGPSSRTAELADYLAAKGIGATFFINGKNVPGRQAALDTIVARGHLLANHTQNHLQLTKLSSSAVISEISRTDAILEDVQPNGPWLIRAPFGAWSGRIANNVNGTGMRKYVGSVFWDVGGQLTSTAAADWACWSKGVSIERCGDLYLSEIGRRRRGIVLMHDAHGKTVDMVKKLVPRLIAEGYRFAKLPDVPSVARALGTGAPSHGAGCFSSTLGREVPLNTCVESRRDEKWYRCEDEEWVGSSATDPKCVTHFALP